MNMFGIIFNLFWWIIAGILIGMFAGRKNRNSYVWGFIGGFPPATIIVLLILAFMPYLCPKCHRPLKDQERKDKNCSVCGLLSNSENQTS